MALSKGTRVVARAPVVARRAAGGLAVEAKVKDANAPARYEALFLLKPGVEEAVRENEITKLRTMFENAGLRSCAHFASSTLSTSTVFAHSAHSTLEG